MELERVLEVFRYLYAPFEDSSKLSSANNGSGRATTPDDILRTITEYCLRHVDFLESSKGLLNFDSQSGEPPHYSSWELTCVILSLLTELKCAVENAEVEQTEDEKAIDVLSIQSQMMVQKSVEIVVGFGISPYLLPGVGVPEKLRKMNPCVPLFLSDAQVATPFEQFCRLAHTLEVLLMCSSHPSLNTLIVPKYTSDILAGLLQVCKSPIAKPNNAARRKDGALSMEQYDHVMAIRKNLHSLSKSTFFTSVPKSSLINSLFLIGSAEKPRWIGTSCNEMLRDIILSPKGLIMVATTMTDSSTRLDTWKLMRIISSLMKDALAKSEIPRCPDKLQTLSEQCIQMITQEQDQETLESHNGSVKTDERISDDKEHISLKLPYGSNVELMRIGLFCGITLLSVDFKWVKSVFWDRLFYHVLLLDTCQGNQAKLDCSVAAKREISSSNSDEIFITVQRAGMSVAFGELLLSVVKPMSVSLPLKSLQPVWSLFLQIFVACERYLSKPVQEPNVAAAAEQLHHKLRDVLILFFEIYSSGSGQTLELSQSTTPHASNSKPTSNISTGGVDTAKNQNIELCDFTLMLLLNQQSHGIPVLNTFDLCESYENREVYVIRVHQEIVTSTSDYNKVYDQYLNVSCQILAKLLKDAKLKAVWAPLIRQLLSWGTKRHNKNSTFGGAPRHKSFKSDEMPTCIEGNDDVKVSVVDCQRFITFKLLGELGSEEIILEQFGNSENADETLGFLELLLNKFTEEACSNSEDDDGFDSSQLVMYALGIIGAIVEAASAATAATQSSGNPSSSTTIQEELIGMWDSLQVFIPHLRKLSQCTKSALSRQGIPEMASGLLLSIGTRGTDYRQSKRNKEEIYISRFEQAMEDASSPMIHVKGHGILELRRLVEEKDPETLGNGVEVLKVFQHNLKNDDSYVYLMAIQGMAAFALKFHQTVVAALIREYDFISWDDIDADVSANDTIPKEKEVHQLRQELDPEESIETRMKVGEILVNVVQKLGQLVPHYRVPLTNVFFRLMRDDNPLIRASALSNLGELCHLLKFSLGIILTEVWYCIESTLNTEKDIHVRRAALHLIVLLLKGVAKEFSVADIMTDKTVAEHLRDVRRYLTRLEQTEVDLVAKTHCQLALQELEFIVKKLLTPINPLEFKMRVLNF